MDTDYETEGNAKQASPMEQAVHLLDEHVRNLDKSLDVLRHRLAPVTREQDEEPGDPDRPSLERSGTSRLAGNLRETTAHVQVLEDRVNRILRDLEV